MNEQYLERMHNLLQDEYDAYLKSIEEPALRGLRVNTLKTNASELFSYIDVNCRKSPFSENGYYFSDQRGLGLSPAYLAGLFYIQEPSASAAVTCMPLKKDMKVLDLCAAPGSKSTQIAEILDNTGFLCVNEINSKRAHILLENIERCGTANTLVLNNTPHEVSHAFPEFFDAVLCDAPCSGEGMMRKNDIAENEWSLQNVLACAKRQKEILHEAYLCVKGGGYLLYSTCTFAREENEEVIAQFLESHHDMHICEIQVPFGRPAFDIGYHTDRAIRIFPMDGGEGHFICLMQKEGQESRTAKEMKSEPMDAAAKQFLRQNLTMQYPYYYVYRNMVYGGTAPFFEAKGCHILRHQVLLGQVKNKRFEPAHHLFTSSFGQIKNIIDLSDENIKKYLHGEEVTIETEKGWYGMAYRGHVVGGAKADGRALKNKYPKGLRLR